MPATFQRAGTATLTIAGQDYSCQLVSFSPGWRDTTPTRTGGELTACGDSLPTDDVDDYPARPALGIVHDWSAAGVSTALAGAVGTSVALVATLDTDQSGSDRVYSGTVIVPPIPDDWIAGKLQRGTITFAATELTGPTAVA